MKWIMAFEGTSRRTNTVAAYVNEVEAETVQGAWLVCENFYTNITQYSAVAKATDEHAELELEVDGEQEKLDRWLIANNKSEFKDTSAPATNLYPISPPAVQKWDHKEWEKSWDKPLGTVKYSRKIKPLSERTASLSFAGTDFALMGG